MNVQLERLNVTQHCPSTCSEQRQKRCFRPPPAVDQGRQPARLQGQGLHTRQAWPVTWGRLRASPQMQMCSPDLAATLALKS